MELVLEYIFKQLRISIWRFIMWSKLFKLNDSAKNILVLGETGCGKRSFLLHYKDGDVPMETELPVFNSLTYNKKLNKGGESIPLVFSLNSASDEMTPSISKVVKYDLIVILTDLSSKNASKALEFYNNYAKIHFPDVKTILVGTKQDQMLESNTTTGLTVTSVKTHCGFEQFDEQLLESLNSDNFKQVKKSMI